MKFIKGKSYALSPLLLLFYFLCLAHFALWPACSNSVAMPQLYYPILAQKASMQSLQDFWSYWLQKAYLLGKKPPSSSDSCFYGLFGLLVELSLVVSTPRSVAVLSLFPRKLAPQECFILVIAMVVIRPVTEELFFRGALVYAYFVMNFMLRFGFQPSSTVAYIFSTLPFRQELYHLSSAECDLDPVLSVKTSSNYSVFLSFSFISCSISTTPCLFTFIRI